jgi:transcriptional regulator with GAF, ATPase, and Fis domain
MPSWRTRTWRASPRPENSRTEGTAAPPRDASVSCEICCIGGLANKQYAKMWASRPCFPELSAHSPSRYPTRYSGCGRCNDSAERNLVERKADVPIDFRVFTSYPLFCLRCREPCVETESDDQSGATECDGRRYPLPLNTSRVWISGWEIRDVATRQWVSCETEGLPRATASTHGDEMDVGLADLLASLTAIGHSIQDVFDPQRFLANFSTQVQRFVPHDRLMIAHLEEGETLSVFAEHVLRGPLLHEGRYTIAFDPGGRYTPAELALTPVLAGETILVTDFQNDPRFAQPGSDLSMALKIGLRSRAAVPLQSGGRIIGALLAESFTPDTYTETHVSSAQQIADLIAPFIENIVLLHWEQRRRGRLAALTGLACVFSASLDLKKNFDQLAEAVRPHLDFDVMGMTLLGASGRDLELVGHVDDNSPDPVPSRIPLDHLSFAATIEAGEPVLIRDAQTELDASRPGDRAIREKGGRSCLGVPLRFCEEVGGLLFFIKRRPSWYVSADVEIAAGIAAQLVVAIQHERLAEEQAHRARLEGRAHQLEQRLTSLRDELGDRYGFDRILGRAPALRDALDRAAKVAPTAATVLLTGESGTGKELVARAIHYSSPRAEGPFVAINCAALPETLVESELFGHERGAFTGADKQKPGRFELAAGGTLFLDEVAELPPAVQAKLLRVLQEHEFQRVGGTVTLQADVRFITATNRDPARAVEEGKFREDLYYRLNVFSVHLPPLRDRGDDILLLANHFMRELSPRLGRGEPGLSRDARTLLLSHRWPGNIRELENAIERALIVSEGGLLTAEHFGIVSVERSSADGRGDQGSDRTASGSLADVEKHAILAALERTKGNKSKAAAALGITRTQLYTRLRRFGIPS